MPVPKEDDIYDAVAKFRQSKGLPPYDPSLDGIEDIPKYDVIITEVNGGPQLAHFTAEGMAEHDRQVGAAYLEAAARNYLAQLLFDGMEPNDRWLRTLAGQALTGEFTP